MPSENDIVILRLIQTHNDTLKAEIQSLREASENRHVEVMDLITQAFPDGDLKSHYQYHMRLVEEAAARKAIRLEVWKKLVSGSVWSILVFAVYKFLEWWRTFHAR
jgi:hypothetical protein